MVRLRRARREKPSKAADVMRLYCAACCWVTEHLYTRDETSKRDIYKCRICGTEQIYYDSKRKQNYDKLGYNGSGGI